MEVTPGRHSAPGRDARAPLVSIRQRPASSAAATESVLKWEETKKWQRKMDTLRSRLADRTKEAESAKGQVTSLRDVVERTMREKQLLQDKIRTLERTVSNLEKAHKNAVFHGDKPDSSGSHGNRVAGYHGDVSGDHAPSSEELQRVILAMRKVVEKLQSENDKLRREALIRTKQQNKKTAVVRASEEEKEREAGDKRQGSGTTVPLAKLALENERLQRSLKREMDRTQQLQLTLKTAEVERERLQDEVRELSIFSRPLHLEE